MASSPRYSMTVQARDICATYDEFEYHLGEIKAAGKKIGTHDGVFVGKLDFVDMSSFAKAKIECSRFLEEVPPIPEVFGVGTLHRSTDDFIGPLPAVAGPYMGPPGPPPPALKKPQGPSRRPTLKRKRRMAFYDDGGQDKCHKCGRSCGNKNLLQMHLDRDHRSN